MKTKPAEQWIKEWKAQFDEKYDQTGISLEEVDAWMVEWIHKIQADAAKAEVESSINTRTTPSPSASLPAGCVDVPAYSGYCNRGTQCCNIKHASLPDEQVIEGIVGDLNKTNGHRPECQCDKCRVDSIMRAISNALPPQKDFESSHDWHFAVEAIIRPYIHEYASTVRSEDKEILDWLDSTGHFEEFHSFIVNNYRPFKSFPIRAAVKAAMGEMI